MPDNKPQDGADNSEPLTPQDERLVSATTTSDDPIDPVDEPGTTPPPKPPKTES